MKKIPLTQGQYAIVDNADYDWLNQWKWRALKDRHGNFYAIRDASQINQNKKRIIPMHREILGLKPENSRQGDHKNHNMLDNRRSNLRVCTRQQNSMNQRPQKNKSSQFKGVDWRKDIRKWRARITIKKVLKHLGFWSVEKDAALAYDQAAKKYFGEFACLNFNQKGRKK